MNIFSGVVVYVLVWWMVFFCTLPIGIEADKKRVKGAMPGAPAEHNLKKKAIWATAISCVVWLIIYGLIKANIVSYHDIADKMAM